MRFAFAHAVVLSVAGLVLAAPGCGGWAHPYTAAELGRDSRTRAGEALVHYLAQPNADVGVCDPRDGTLQSFVHEDYEAFLEGLDDGDVAPDRWAECARRLVLGMTDHDVRRAMTASARLFIDHLDVAEEDRGEMAILQALRKLLDHRRAGVPLPREVETDLREALAGAGSARARAMGAAVLEGLELDRGVWHGEKVTSGVLADIDDEALLRRMTRRLPNEVSRRQARARIVEIHIARTPYEWVRHHAEETRKRVLRTGRNALDPRAHPIVAARYDVRDPGGVIVVEQDLASQSARLLFQRGEDTTVVPGLDLRRLLSFAVEGLDREVTLCGPTDELAVSPCIDSADLTLHSPVVRLRSDGTARLVDGLHRGRLLELVRRGESLGIELRALDSHLLRMQWPLRVLQPPPVIYGQGQDLEVRVERTAGRLLVWYGLVDEPPSVAVVEREDVPAFHVVTRGAAGADGSQGSAGADGASGMDGRNASCPSMPGTSGTNGQVGSAGGRGGAGGPGGDGGDVHLTVLCPEPPCGSLVATARRVVRTEGGPGGRGGPGGPGGRGGAGGRGGSGASCTDASGQTRYLSGGSPGMRGSDGPQGPRGPDGPAGEPGAIHVEVVTPEGAQ